MTAKESFISFIDSVEAHRKPPLQLSRGEVLIACKAWVGATLTPKDLAEVLDESRGIDPVVLAAMGKSDKGK